MPNQLLRRLLGHWSGTSRTWFRPDQIGDESKVTGEFRAILGGLFVRHCYAGEMQKRPRNGEETIAFNSVTKRFQTTWVDDFHMNYGIMFSEGEATETGFAVIGEYDVAEESPPWRWKTVFDLADDDRLTITAFNISPDGTEERAVETLYVRKERCPP